MTKKKPENWIPRRQRDEFGRSPMWVVVEKDTGKVMGQWRHEKRAHDLVEELVRRNNGPWVDYLICLMWFEPTTRTGVSKYARDWLCQNR